MNNLTIVEFAGVVAKNYAQCRADQGRLDELQKWVTNVSK